MTLLYCIYPGIEDRASMSLSRRPFARLAIYEHQYRAYTAAQTPNLISLVCIHCHRARCSHLAFPPTRSTQPAQSKTRNANGGTYVATHVRLAAHRSTSTSSRSTSCPPHTQ